MFYYKCKVIKSNTENGLLFIIKGLLSIIIDLLSILQVYMLSFSTPVHFQNINRFRTPLLNK